MATKNIPLFLRHSPTPSVRDFALLAGIEAAVRGTVILTIAEPLSHRREVAVEMALALALPLLVMVPLSVAAIFYGLGIGLRPLETLRAELARRGAKQLTSISSENLRAHLKAAGYTEGTANSQAQQMFQLFPALKIATRIKNILTINPDSTIVAQYKTTKAV